MKIAFRVDASIEIGNGHVMRCLALANVLVKRGGDCYFICRKLPGSLIEFIRGQGFKVFEISTIVDVIGRNR